MRIKPNVETLTLSFVLTRYINVLTCFWSMCSLSLNLSTMILGKKRSKEKQKQKIHFFLLHPLPIIKDIWFQIMLIWLNKFSFYSMSSPSVQKVVCACCSLCCTEEYLQITLYDGLHFTFWRYILSMSFYCIYLTGLITWQFAYLDYEYKI